MKDLLKEQQEYLQKLAGITEDITSIGPEGYNTQDPKILQNLSSVLRSVESSIRPKLLQLFTDPSSSKALTTSSQRIAVFVAIAMAFGITSKDFTQISTSVAQILNKSLKTNDKDQTKA